MKKQIFPSMNADIHQELVPDQIQSVISESQSIKNDTGNFDTSLKYYSIEQVSSLLGVCRTTIHNWRKQGNITYKKIGRRIYFTEFDIQKALKSIDLSELQGIAARLGGNHD